MQRPRHPAQLPGCPSSDPPPSSLVLAHSAACWDPSRLHGQATSEHTALVVLCPLAAAETAPSLSGAGVAHGWKCCSDGRRHLPSDRRWDREVPLPPQAVRWDHPHSPTPETGPLVSFNDVAAMVQSHSYKTFGQERDRKTPTQTPPPPALKSQLILLRAVVIR